eukprot:8325305-Alexandrium_andersonii.AAC.1
MWMLGLVFRGHPLKPLDLTGVGVRLGSILYRARGAALLPVKLGRRHAAQGCRGWTRELTGGSR